MPKATNRSGALEIIKDCEIIVGDYTVTFKILPEISDSKSASYKDEPIIGRSFPIKAYSHSENRTISIRVHFIVAEDSDIQKNLADKRALESAVYPRNDASPYRPPPICKIKCKKMLADEDICAVMKSYSTQYPTNVAWDEGTNLPYYFTMQLTFDVVYPTSQLPGQEKILGSGG
jgi:hypothetical protein